MCGRAKERDRDTETQRHRNTEAQKYGDTETQRHRVRSITVEMTYRPMMYSATGSCVAQPRVRYR